jgi:glycosyltransferase involved in cell wall biosynthesis
LKNPLITILMPNLNGEKYLKRAIDSFTEQGYARKQLIVIDAKSTDRSHQIIQSYSGNSDILWIQESDKGISDALNKGIRQSSGDVIGYMGSDDILYRGIFDNVAYHLSVIDYDVIYFNSYTYHLKEQKCALQKCLPIEFTKQNLLQYGTLVGLQNIYFRRHILDKYQYDVENKYSMDYELYLRISDQGYLFLYVDAIASINIFDGNISQKFGNNKQREEAINVAKHYGDNKTNYFFNSQKKLRHRLVNKLKRLFQ